VKIAYLIEDNYIIVVIIFCLKCNNYKILNDY